MKKTLEQAILDKILYIGDEIPKSVAEDKRSKFVVLGTPQELIDEVCDIVAHHHHPKEDETVNFKSLYDADLVTNLEEKQKENPIEPEKLTGIIEKSFLTGSGANLARKVLIE